jgi:hypothetical protein
MRVGVVEGSRAERVAMWREQRDSARARGDTGIARCAERELDRLGVIETTQDATELEHAVPEKPRRGRRPKPRCEHDIIAERCPDCNPEMAV